MKPAIIRLDLQNPLFYIPDSALKPFDLKTLGTEPSASEPFNKEMLFCFEIEKAASLEFEPKREFFPGTLLACGQAMNGNPADSPEKPIVELPKARYYFAQVRELLDKEAIIDLIMEVQQEALWQRAIPENRLYLRYLYEDNSFVTQVFRPYKE